jgi:hypothetical protein
MPTTEKPDRRYARNAGRPPRDTTKPLMYRYDLFQRAKRERYAEIRTLAGYVELAPNTVRDVLDGNASKLENIWKVANHFRIPWLAIFDIDRKLTVEYDGEGREYVITAGLDGPATPIAALGSRGVKTK